jgi:hypothetical protein
MADITFQLQGKPYHTSFCVADVEVVDVLLGLDFLMSVGARVDLAKMLVIIGEQKVRIGSGDITPVHAVRLVDNEVLPAGSANILYDINESTFKNIARFICQVYCPNGVSIVTLKDLRWYLFCKQMADSDRLPPTEGSMRQHSSRCHVQAVTWSQADIPIQIQLDPCDPWLV